MHKSMKAQIPSYNHLKFKCVHISVCDANPLKKSKAIVLYYSMHLLEKPRSVQALQALGSRLETSGTSRGPKYSNLTCGVPMGTEFTLR